MTSMKWLGLSAMVAWLVGCSGGEPLGTQRGTGIFLTYSEAGERTSEVAEETEIQLAAGEGSARSVTIPAFGCTFFAMRRDDGQYEGLAADPSCDLRSIAAGRSAVLDEETQISLVGGNVSFYEGGAAFVLLHGAVSRNGTEIGVWTWQHEPIDPE